MPSNPSHSGRILGSLHSAGGAGAVQMENLWGELVPAYKDLAANVG